MGAARAEKALSDYTARAQQQQRQVEAISTVCSGCQQGMHWSNYCEGAYACGWACSNFMECGGDRLSKGAFRWFCKDCQNDYCDFCIPRPANLAEGGEVSHAPVG